MIRWYDLVAASTRETVFVPETIALLGVSLIVAELLIATVAVLFLDHTLWMAGILTVVNNGFTFDQFIANDACKTAWMIVQVVERYNGSVNDFQRAFVTEFTVLVFAVLVAAQADRLFVFVQAVLFLNDGQLTCSACETSVVVFLVVVDNEMVFKTITALHAA